MHVRLTDKARRLLNDKQLARKIQETIHKKRDQLFYSGQVQVDGTKIKVISVTHNRFNGGQ